MSIHLHIVHGRCHVISAELSSCYKDHIFTSKILNIWSFKIFVKQLSFNIKKAIYRYPQCIFKMYVEIWKMED